MASRSVPEGNHQLFIRALIVIDLLIGMIENMNIEAGEVVGQPIEVFTVGSGNKQHLITTTDEMSG
jgi:hypothetical protein